MLPVLIDLGFVKLYTFGVFLVLAFFWSTFLLWKQIALTSYKEDEIFDGMFLALVGGLFFGRLQHVVLHFRDFGFDFLKFILVNGYPGIDVIGFTAGFFFTFYLFSLSRKIEYKKIVDYLVTPFLPALAIGKIGAFFSGTEIGAQTQFFLALSYPNLDGARHLTSLYESIFFFVGSFFSYKVLRSIRRGHPYEGFNFVFFLWYASLVFTLFDPLKAFRIAVFQGVGTNALISGFLLLTTSLYFLYYLRRSMHKGFRALLRKGR